MKKGWQQKPLKCNKCRHFEWPMIIADMWSLLSAATNNVENDVITGRSLWLQRTVVCTTKHEGQSLCSLAPPPLRLEIKGLVWVAYRTCVRLRESGATNQIAQLLINA